MTYCLRIFGTLASSAGELLSKLEKDLIQSAKLYSAKTGKSVSKIVADYFTLIDKKLSVKQKEISPLTRSLRRDLRDLRDIPDFPLTDMKFCMIRGAMFRHSLYVYPWPRPGFAWQAYTAPVRIFYSYRSRM